MQTAFVRSCQNPAGRMVQGYANFEGHVRTHFLCEVWDKPRCRALLVLKEGLEDPTSKCAGGLCICEDMVKQQHITACVCLQPRLVPTAAAQLPYLMR